MTGYLGASDQVEGDDGRGNERGVQTVGTMMHADSLTDADPVWADPFR